MSGQCRKCGWDVTKVYCGECHIGVLVDRARAATENQFLREQVEKLQAQVQVLAEREATAASELEELRADRERHRRACPADVFAKILREEIHPDFSIVCQGHAFRVHRAVLCARSVVLERMLEIGMRESFENKLDMDDINKDAAWAFIFFLYSGRLPETFSHHHAVEVLYAAHKYHITSLEKIVLLYVSADVEQHSSAENSSL